MFAFPIVSHISLSDEQQLLLHHHHHRARSSLSPPRYVHTEEQGGKGASEDAQGTALSCTSVVGFARAACHLRDTQSALAPSSFFFFFSLLRNPRRFPISDEQLGPSSRLSVRVRAPFNVHRRAENRIRDSRISTFTPFARILGREKEEEEEEEGVDEEGEEVRVRGSDDPVGAFRFRAVSSFWICPRAFNRPVGKAPFPTLNL